MQHLHNSRGDHIANVVNNQLHSTRGSNVGHYLPARGIFIDMHGRYLGEILYNNRLVYNRSSPYRSVNFGVYGNYGNVGNYGNYGNYGSIALPAGYQDVDPAKLNQRPDGIYMLDLANHVGFIRALV